MTRKLFHDDSYKTKFQAKIIDIQYKKNTIVLILDQTYFYPNAGGQLCDKGNIAGYSVIDIQELNGSIIHYLDCNTNFDIGMTVTAEIDWKIRFDHMQQHTGQHILSRVLNDFWKKETLSFHMGEEICTIDIPYTPLEEDKIKKIEDMANAVIYANKSIYQYYRHEDNNNIPDEIRKKELKLNEKLRIVEIDKFDINACGGTHCRNTGQVAVIKITGWERRKDKSRITFLCGNRALIDYQKKHHIIKNLSSFFTTGIDYLEEKVTKISEEKKELDKAYNYLEKKLIQFEANLLKTTNNKDKKGYHIIKKIFSEKTIQQLRELALVLINEKDYIVIIGSEKSKPILCLACSENIALHMGDLLKELINEKNGKGGGSKYIAMAKIKDSGNLTKIIDDSVTRITEIIDHY